MTVLALCLIAGVVSAGLGLPGQISHAIDIGRAWLAAFVRRPPTF